MFINSSFILKHRPCTRRPNTIMFAEDDSIIRRPIRIQEMTTCTSHLPHRSFAPYLHTESLEIHGTTGTKCLPRWITEGGTSPAIRGNWQYLQSAQECWHQFPPRWPWGRVSKDQTRRQKELRSPCAAETDQRFAPTLKLVTPLSSLGYAHSARQAGSDSVTPFLLKKGHSVITESIWQTDWCSFDWWQCFPLFFSQNNGSLVWCQNHKQCSKVTWFHNLSYLSRTPHTCLIISR